MNKLFSVFAITSLLTLTACSGNVREALGIQGHAPDEFMVLPRTNLAIPQEFTLPKPQKESDKTSTIQASAKETLYGSNNNTSNDLGNAEKSLLKKTKTNQATSNIREIINLEAKEKRESRTILDDISETLRPLESRGILNPDAEKTRLEQKNTSQ